MVFFLLIIVPLVTLTALLVLMELEANNDEDILQG